LNIVVGAGLLVAKLIAGEAEDDKVVGVLLLDGLVELLEAFVLGGEAALGGRVDDKDDFALVIGEGDFLPLFCRDARKRLSVFAFCCSWCLRLVENDLEP
jgi:hypothetical protein